MGQIKLQRSIPTDKLAAYQNAGWTTAQELVDAVLVNRVIVTKNNLDKVRNTNLKAPYLIQHGHIVRPLNAQQGAALSAAVEMSYMGSAEFEFGALPEALRVVQSVYSLCRMHLVEELTATSGDRTFGLRIFGNFDSKEQLDYYVGMLKGVIDGTVHTKENARLKLDLDNKLAPDFWFDLTNGVLMSYDKQFMSRVQDHLLSSFSRMDSNQD